MRMKMVIELDCDNTAFFIGDNTCFEWFYRYVLMNETDEGALYLHSNELGESIGRVTVIKLLGNIEMKTAEAE